MGTSPLDSSINGSAYMTFAGLSALVIDFLANLCLPEIVYIGSTYVSKKLPAFALCEKDVGTTLASISSSPPLCGRHVYFANILEDSNNHLEVSDVQRRQSQSEVTEMAIACL